MKYYYVHAIDPAHPFETLFLCYLKDCSRFKWATLAGDYYKFKTKEDAQKAVGLLPDRNSKIIQIVEREIEK